MAKSGAPQAAPVAQRYTEDEMLKRLILWDFARGSWQYDVVVGLILAFIFLTPRAWFRDQPRMPHATNIVLLDSRVYWVEPELLANVPDAERAAQLSATLSRHLKRSVQVAKVDAIFDSEREIKGYLALTK
jgi:hypothetical protein